MPFSSCATINQLTQAMVNAQDSVFVIKKQYDLNGETISFPEEMVLKFAGGKLMNGVIDGNRSKIISNQDTPLFGENITINGSWIVPDIYDTWFEFEQDSCSASNGLISNMLALASDSIDNQINFNRNVTYYIEHPYVGDVQIGDQVSFEYTETGSRKFHYREIFDDDFSYLRIFTIPSNVRICINSHLQLLPTELGAYFIFWGKGKENITIYGNGSIAGDRVKHKYSTTFRKGNKTYYGEWGMILTFLNCYNVVVKDITLCDSFGDCLMFMGDDTKGNKIPRLGQNFIAENVKVISSRRQGFALGGHNIIIKNCHFENCGIYDFNATAIDIEPSSVLMYPDLGCANVLIENCTFKNNLIDLNIYRNAEQDYGEVTVTVKNIIFTSPISMNRSNWVLFDNCEIPSFGNTKDQTPIIFNFCNHILFNNCKIGKINRNSFIKSISKGALYKDCEILEYIK